MASGRLGSAKIGPSRAALLYSNASANPASLSVQATTLSSTLNTNIALSIDSATVALNNTTVNTAIASGSMTQRTRWLDPLSGTDLLRVNRVSFTNPSGNDQFPVQYWNGAAWVTGAQAAPLYGPKTWQKIDPYFISNPSAYGKTSAGLPIGLQYDTSASSVRFKYYENLAAFTGAQFRLSQMYQDPGVASVHTQDVGYAGFGFSVDPYTDYVISTGDSGFSVVFYGKTGSPSGSYTSNNIVYQKYGAQSLSSFTTRWYFPRFQFVNGISLFQNANNGSTFVFSDLITALANPNNGVGTMFLTGNAEAAWWNINLPYSWASGGGAAQWFDYNPNTDRYYFQTGQESGTAGSQNRNIYSFTRAGLIAKTPKGDSSSITLSDAIFTNHGRAPWGENFVERPQRIGAALWWTCAENDVAYVSTDLATWQTAISYFASIGEAANTFNKSQISLTSYLYAQNATANVSKFDSNFTSVAETAVLEYNTSVSNFQRTGIVLSPGDKLYAQNYGGAVPVSITAMGYED